MTELFTVGNLLTLGISFLAIFIFRYLDKQNRSVDLAREYGKKLKDDIADFAEKKAVEVKDSGLILDVQKSAVKAALDRLTEANADLVEKTAAVLERLEDVTRIGERISVYDRSMEDLIRMTAKVEENMIRLKEESAFVDATAKKVGGIKNLAEELEKDLRGVELHFDRENTAALEKTTEAILARVESRVVEFQSAAEIVERDLETVNKAMGDALEKSKNKASKMEEEALYKYREEALVRIHHFQGTVEEKFREYHENAKVRIGEIQGLVHSCKKEVEDRLAEFKTDQNIQWKRLETLSDDALKLDTQLRLSMETAETKVRRDFSLYEEAQKKEWDRASAEQAESAEALKIQMAALEQELNLLKNRAYDNVSEKLQIFEDDFINNLSKRGADIDIRLNEWRSTLEGNLAALGEKTETKLNNLEKKTETGLNNVSEKLQVFENDFNADLGQRGADIDIRLNEWRSTLEGNLAVLGEKTETELNILEKKTETGLNNVSEKLRVFENDFNADLGQRGADIDTRLNEWQSTLEGNLAALGEKTEAELNNFKEKSETRLNNLKEKSETELDNLEKKTEAELDNLEKKTEAELDNLEKNTNAELNKVSEKLQAFENEFKADLSQRSAGIDTRLNEWQSTLEENLAALGEKTETRLHNQELSFKEEFTARIEEQGRRILFELGQLKQKAAAFEEKIQNDLDVTESRISGLSSTAEEIRQGLKEFHAQTKLFEKADENKILLERSMETLKAELGGIEERRSEAARLETEFIKIRRLEDEVNTKMTRFLSEKSHLDVMEKDFEKLIQTSMRVQEGLKEVTGADDTMQKIQVSLRKLEDAVEAANEKYKRVQEKNDILETANRGIEQNYQTMNETELALRKCRENIDRAEEELDSLRPSIEKLAAASEKARVTGEKLAILDSSLAAIEERIEKMDVAREWLARTETRFDELNREAQGELKLLEAVLKDETKKTPGTKGAPPPSARDAVIRLRRQGWETEAIARNLKISRGEVELILEMGGKD